MLTVCGKDEKKRERGWNGKFYKSNSQNYKHGPQYQRFDGG